MNESGYQGWTSYATWAVALWLNNEEPSYRHWRERGRELATKYPANVSQAGLEHEYKTLRVALADELEATLEAGMPELSGFWGDLLRSAWEDVNWVEIADSFLEE